jgi:hypothetical protein
MTSNTRVMSSASRQMGRVSSGQPIICQHLVDFRYSSLASVRWIRSRSRLDSSQSESSTPNSPSPTPSSMSTTATSVNQTSAARKKRAASAPGRDARPDNVCPSQTSIRGFSAKDLFFLLLSATDAVGGECGPFRGRFDRKQSRSEAHGKSHPCIRRARN